jgi:hypothetical protein
MVMRCQGPINNSVDAPRCPRCGLRGATPDWQRWGGCPHRCGYTGQPVDDRQAEETERA